MFRRLGEFLYPELAYFPAPDTLRAAETKLFRSLMPSSITLSQYTILSLIVFFATLRWRPFSPGYTFVLAVGQVLLFLTAALLIRVFILTRSQLRQMLRKTLREQGVPICILCGYDLKGCVSDKCPECGEPIIG